VGASAPARAAVDDRLNPRCTAIAVRNGAVVPDGGAAAMYSIDDGFPTMTNSFRTPILPWRPLVAAALALAASAPFAQTQLKDPWVRATVAQQKATGLFVQITSASGGRLVEARSPVAGVVEIHEMVIDGNVMKMRAIPGLDLPAGKPVELKPGGYHVMLMDLKRPLNEGDTVPVTLIVESRDGKRETIDVQAPVRALGAAMPPAHGKH
jgi:copper(I)-binding protein